MKKRKVLTRKLKRIVAPKVVRSRNAFVGGKDKKIELLTRERNDALAREAATADVLKAISSSPGDLEPVFQAMLENATRICEARLGVLYRREGDFYRVEATYGAPPEYVACAHPVAPGLTPGTPPRRQRRR